MSDERISRLEVKISHLEITLEEITLSLYTEQKKSERLEKLCRELSDRIKTLTEMIGEPSGAALNPERKPPHY